MGTNNSTNNFGISRYIVSTTPGNGSYRTIQSAVNAATAAGGGSVFLQQGTYTEDLDLSAITNFVEVVGATGLGDEGQVEIVGTHIPPTANTTFIFRNTKLSSPTAIFDSSAAGQSHLVIIDALLNVTNGYTFDLPNWTGIFELFDINPGAGSDGGVNNTGGASLFVFDAGLGAGTANSMVLSGTTVLFGAGIACPLTIQGTANLSIDSSTFTQGLTFSDSSTQTISNSRISSGATAAITTTSSNPVVLNNVVIDSTANPVIAGTGSVEFTSVSYVEGFAVAGTITKIYTTEIESGTAFLQNLSFDRGATKIIGDGQLIIGDSTGVPKIATLTAGSNVSIVNGNGSITINASSGSLTWNAATTDTTMVAGNAYIVANNVSLVTLTLPDPQQLGDMLQIVGFGAGGWKIAQNAGQIIHLGSSATTTGVTGFLEFVDQYDCVTLVSVNSSQWVAFGAIGNITVN